MMRAVVILSISIVRSCVALFRSRQNQAIVELALRQQLAVYARRRPRPRLSPVDRCAFSIFVLADSAWLFRTTTVLVSRAEAGRAGLPDSSSSVTLVFEQAESPPGHFS